jgi:hypothetical protein
MKNKASHLLSSLPAYCENGAIYAVAEASKGSLVKLKYEIMLGALSRSRIHYPWVCLDPGSPSTASSRSLTDTSR